MTEPTAPDTSTTRPQPVFNDSAPPHRPAPTAPRRRVPRTRISGMRVALIAGIAAAGAARITQLRQVMRRDRRQSTAGDQPG